MQRYAKTLYKPDFPHEINEQISKYTNCKLPAFFEYAKDKEKSQVRARNGSFVNKIFDRIPNKPISSKGLKLGDIHYKDMMSNGLIVCTKEVSDLYDKLNKQYRHMLNMKDEHINNLRYVACKIRDEFSEIGYTDETITDMLVEYLYGNRKRYKQLLWFCYGRYIVNNLENNIGERKTRLVQCVDCGEWIEVQSINKRTCRCSACQNFRDREYQRSKKRRQRENAKMSPFLN